MNIVGNGMIARSFTYYNIEGVCIFASGISNSIEICEKDCEKEYILIKTTAEKSKDTIVYFSTTSINNSDTIYTRHKLKIENYIKKNVENYIILRLPNVIGNTKNKNQLVPYFYNKIINREKIYVKKEVYRDLIDVADIPKIIQYFIEKKIKGVVNISLGNKIKVKDIVLYLGIINNETPVITEIESNEKDMFFDEKISKVIISEIPNLELNPYKIIYKYYKN
jgi:nucleoside-diphosphate-sugar epimerase